MKQTVVIVMVMLLFVKTNAQSYQFQKEDNKIAIIEDGKKTEIASNAEAESAFEYNQKIFFLDKTANGSIRIYDINTKRFTDAITIGMKSEVGYTVKSAIVNMLADAKGGKLYFTTKDDYKGTTQYMTWRYDINTKTYDVYCDGKAVSLSADNTLEVVFSGKDYNGEYQQKSYYNAAYRQLIKQDDRVYSITK
eukprot:TRINITY_DN95111_c0_g1_i1.p2 TRINITY_DN95111_c0_g1~~TRINITY_DN95111_c0_g1_i1.p2  ORF type:complete len:193 (-),score=27.65 TRINITY_DN95111_c0_g1_i1:32-610(-)